VCRHFLSRSKTFADYSKAPDQGKVGGAKTTNSAVATLMKRMLITARDIELQ
jgi:hypothetical protein